MGGAIASEVVECVEFVDLFVGLALGQCLLAQSTYS
jgi:hypothetical protein